jgi:hypothetical protein
MRTHHGCRQHFRSKSRLCSIVGLILDLIELVVELVGSVGEVQRGHKLGIDDEALLAPLQVNINNILKVSYCMYRTNTKPSRQTGWRKADMYTMVQKRG